MRTFSVIANYGVLFAVHPTFLFKGLIGNWEEILRFLELPLHLKFKKRFFLLYKLFIKQGDACNLHCRIESNKRICDLFYIAKESPTPVIEPCCAAHVQSLYWAHVSQFPCDILN